MAHFPVVATDFPLFRVHVKSSKKENLGRVYLEQFCIIELNAFDKCWVIRKLLETKAEPRNWRHINVQFYLCLQMLLWLKRRNKLPAFWHLRQFHNCYSWFATWSGIKSVQNYFVKKFAVNQRTLKGFKCYFRSRRSGIKTDRFPKRAPMVQVSRRSLRAFFPGKFFGF